MGTTRKHREEFPPESLPARDVYLGHSHIAVKKACNRLTHRGVSCDWWVVSAKHGMLHQWALITPYSETFRKKNRWKLREMGEELGFPRVFLEVVSGARLVVSMVSRECVEAMHLSKLPEEGPLFVFVGEYNGLKLLPVQDNVLRVEGSKRLLTAYSYHKYLVRIKSFNLIIDEILKHPDSYLERIRGLDVPRKLEERDRLFREVK